MFRRICLYHLCVFIISATYVQSVKVDVQGSLSLGQDIIDTINFHVLRSSGRRFLTNEEPVDISLLIKNSNLCTDVYFCNDSIKRFFENYILSLSTVTENLLEDINAKNKLSKDNVYLLKQQFILKIKESLVSIHRIFKDAEVGDKDTVSLLKMIMKKINGLMQTTFTTFIESWNVTDKYVTQNLISNLGKVESLEEANMCKSLILCRVSDKCSKMLKRILRSLVEMPEYYIREFVRSFHEELAYTWFYTILGDETANEFKNILNDLAFTNVAPAKKVLTSFLNTLETSASASKSEDVRLVHLIFSDLDHIYDQNNEEDLIEFAKDFEEWKNDKKQLNQGMRKFMKKIMTHISSSSEVLLQKLKNEVKVFLELTIDPEKKN